MTELTGNVVLDVNHALAGKTLIFDIEIDSDSSRSRSSARW